MMKLLIRYNRETVSIEVPADAKVSQLNDAISESLSIPPQKQKLICLGKNLNNPDESLSTYKIKDGSKLLLMQTETLAKPDTPKPPPRSQWCQAPQPEFLKAAPHIDIINKGVPANCEKPYQSQMTLLPKTPFVVYNTEGVISKLSFESDAVWTEAEDGKQERIFFTDLRSSLIQEIPGHEHEYNALCLITKYGKRWFYYIPNQYQSLLSKILSP